MTDKVSQKPNNKVEVNNAETNSIHDKLNNMREPPVNGEENYNKIEAEVTFKQAAVVAMNMAKTAPWVLLALIQALTILGLVYLLIK